jgi:hypothetical protein
MSGKLCVGDLVAVPSVSGVGRVRCKIDSNMVEAVTFAPSGEEFYPVLCDQTPLAHKFVQGEMVYIVNSNTYVKTFSGYAYVYSMEKFLGKVVTYDKAYPSTGGFMACGCSRAMHWLNTVPLLVWPEEALIPVTFDAAVPNGSDDIDSLLEALYDCRNGKGGDMAGLLGKYRKLTGKDRPGFMG